MKKILSITILLTLLLNLTSCKKEEISVNKYYKTIESQTWSISLEDNFVWLVESVRVTMLWSKNWWKIVSFFVKEWDKVSEWQIIAKLDNSEYIAQVNSSEKILNKIWELSENIKKTYDWQKEITSSQERQTNIWIDWIEKIINETWKSTSWSLLTISSQIETWKETLETAKIELEQTKNVYNNKENNIYSNAKNAITMSMIVDANSIKYLDEIFWIINKENDDKNDDFQDFLGAHNLVQKSETILEFKTVYKKYLEYKDLYEKTILNKEPSKDETEKVLELWVSFNNTLRNHLKNVYETIDNSITNASTFSSETISNHKNKLSTFWKDIESVLISVNWNYTLWLKWTLESIDDLNTEKEKVLSLLQKKIDLSEKSIITIWKNYEEASIWNNTKIIDLENKKDLSLEKLNEIESIKNNIENEKNSKTKELELELEKAKLNQEINFITIDNSVIRAPFSWIISKKFIDVWWVVMPSQAIVEISEEKDIKVSFYLSDSGLNKFNINSKVKVKIDWNDKLQNWFIKMIFPIKDEITKKTKIEVKLENSKNIKIWSTAKLYSEDKSKSWIIIPNTAIIEYYMNPWVYVIKNENCSISPWERGLGGFCPKSWKVIVELKQIKILFQNNDFSLVEWLSNWEILITEWKENIFDWEELK